MKVPFLTFVALFIYTFANAQIKLEKRTYLEGRLEMLIPTDFKQMSAEMIGVKYPNRTQQPQAVLSDDDGTVNIIVNYLPQSIQPSQVAEFKEFQLNFFKKNRPDAQWLADGVKQINGKTFGFLKFTIDAVDQKVYNYMVFSELNGKILMLSFNCTEKLLPKWQATAEEIMASIALK